MSAVVTFAIPLANSPDPLQARIVEACGGSFQGVDLVREGPELYCYLSWWEGSPEQREAVRRVATVLQAASETGGVSYFRSSDIANPPASVDRSLTLDEIFTPENEPTMGPFVEERLRLVF